MSVMITQIQPQDSIASSRLTLNSNFSALKTGVDSLQILLNPTTAVLTGVKSVTVNDNAVPYSSSILYVGKGSSLLGNVIMGTTGASTSVLVNGNGGFTIVQSNLTIGNGNLALSGAASLATFGGHISVTKENRQPGVANAFSAIIGLTDAVQPTPIPVADLKYVVLRNDGTTGLTATLSAGNPGQVLEIFHIKGASGFPVYVIPAVGNFEGLIGPIQMTQTGDTLKLVYDGKWYLWNYSSSSFAVAGGATSSSVSYTLL